MIRKRWLFILFFIASIAITSSEHESRGMFGRLKSLFKSPNKWYRNYVAKDKKSTDLEALVEQKRHNDLQTGEPLLEGSMVSVEENLKFPYSLLKRNLFLNAGPRQYNIIDCSCDPFGAVNNNCLTICTSLAVSCGQTCTNSVIYTASSTVDALGAITSSTTSFINYGDCEKLSVICSASTATATCRFAKSVAVVIAAIAIAVRVPAIVENPQPVPSFPPIDTPMSQTPENNLDIPVDGPTFPDDGCRNSSVRFNNTQHNNTSKRLYRRSSPYYNRNPFAFNNRSFEISLEFDNQTQDQNCTNLFTRCSDPFQWVTLDVTTLQGRCTPRLCGRRRVFVGRDELCHDINDPNECRGNRRLYYSAFGDPLCDCPIGQFPFPTSNNDCVSLFTQGPCPAGMVVSLIDRDTLTCAPSQCPALNSPSGQPFQMFPFGNGQCFALGTRGPCPATPLHLLGYDVFKRKAVCVNMQNPSSPYFSSFEEDEIIDRFYNQDSAEFNDVRVVLVQENALERNDTIERRQGSGVFQLPNRFPDSLLNPCRPGDQGGFNHKCSNPLVPNYEIRDVLQPVQSPYKCQSDHFLQATSQCSNDNRGSSCGPSHRYNPNTGQCRPIF